MADTKGGLSYFDEGGSADASNASLPVTETITIGGTKIPLKTAINSDITKNLQEEVDRRSGGFWNPVLRGFERNAAFTSDNPAQSLAAINAQHRAEDESIFNMRNNIAAIKAAQQLAATRAAQWNANNLQAGDMGQMSGAGASAGAGGLNISQEQLAIENSLDSVDEKIASRNKYLAGINAANARAQADAAGNTQQLYRDQKTGAEIGYFTPNQVKANPSLIGNAVPSNAPPIAKTKIATNYTPTGNASFDDAVKFVFGVEGGYKDKDGNTGAPVNMGINQKYHPNVDVRNLTPDQARDIYKQEYWDAIGGDNLNPTTAKIAMDAAVNQGVDYAKRLIAETGGDPEKMMSHRMSRYAGTVAGDKTGQQTQNLKGWMNRLDLLRNELGQPKTNVQTAATSTTNPNLSAIEQHKIDVKKAENATEADLARQKEEDKKATDYMAAIQSARKDLAGVLSSSQNIQKHAINSPGAFFYPGQGGVLGGATALPVVGEGISDVYASLAGDAKARAEIKQASQALGVENTKNLFAGLAARFGAQLTGIGTAAKGVGTELPAETNRFNARLMELTAYMVDEQAKAYENYKGGNAFQFLNSPENKRIEAHYLGALQREFPDRIKLDNRPPAEPKIGDVTEGYRFKGGDPSKKENWEKQ
jgi:hypothetical protein